MSNYESPYRTHAISELKDADAAKEVMVCGWQVGDAELDKLTLRDRSGELLVTFSAEVAGEAGELAPGACVQAEGEVEKGEGEEAMPVLKASALKVLSKSAEFPLDLEAEGENAPDEEERLQYRYLGLRDPKLQSRLRRRHKLFLALRNYMTEKGFLEVDTPVLGRWTEDATSAYVAAAGVGKAFALSQSPQVYKQLLMVGGCDRYFQLARCFRLEKKLDPEHQPEFTSFDFELSFADEPQVYELVDGLLAHLYKSVLEKEIKTPLPRMSHAEALSQYGTDRPDLRFDLAMHEVSEEVKAGTGPLAEAKDGRALRVPAEHVKELDDEKIAALAVAPEGVEGVVVLWGKVSEGPKLEGPLAEALEESARAAFLEKLEAAAGDAVFLVAAEKDTAQSVGGALRARLGKDLKLTEGKEHAFCWVNEFPYFAFDLESKSYLPARHPFTQPVDDDCARIMAEDPLESLGEQSDENLDEPAKGALLGKSCVSPDDPERGDLLKLRSKSYELILNGQEIGTGSVRVHDLALQEKIFSMFGYDKESVERRFGHVLEAFRYGVPPHAGASIGIDRVLMEIEGVENLADIMAFPKSSTGACPLTGSPSELDPEFLKSLLESGE